MNAVASRNVKFISHSDQGGRGDGVQIMVHRGYAYIGHGYSNGITVLDVRDPKNPRPVAFLPCPPDTRAIHQPNQSKRRSRSGCSAEHSQADPNLRRALRGRNLRRGVVSAAIRFRAKNRRPALNGRAAITAPELRLRGQTRAAPR